MSNYKLKNHTAVYDPVLDMYDIFDGCGGRMGTVTLDLLIDFGWEKVEEPFKENEWMFFSHHHAPLDLHQEILFRCSKVDNSTHVYSREWYELRSSELYLIETKHVAICHIDEMQRATPDQIERILSVVARHKGYKKGVVVEGILMDMERPIRSEEMFYRADYDSLYFKADSPNDPSMIYNKGTWAKIKEEPKAAEPQVEWLDKETIGYLGSDIRALENIVWGNYDAEKPINVVSLLRTTASSLNLKADKILKAINYKGTEKDWKTAKVLSWESACEISEPDILHVGERRFLLIDLSVLEEEAKKRTNQ